MQISHNSDFFMSKQPTISISIVSHGQGDMVLRLLQSIRDYETEDDLEIIITENLIDASGFFEKINDQTVTKISNAKSKSFAENHNQAFKNSNGEFFCALNPDVLFIESIFNKLRENIEQKLGDIVAPVVIDPDYKLQDSFRPLPTPAELFFRRFRLVSLSTTDQVDKFHAPDWIAGIFLLMRSETYKYLGGFDERYRMYFEDVDFSTRARLEGYKLFVNTSCQILHDARRMSRRRPNYLILHLSSAIQFFTSDVYKQAKKLDPDQ